MGIYPGLKPPKGLPRKTRKNFFHREGKWVLFKKISGHFRGKKFVANAPLDFNPLLGITYTLPSSGISLQHSSLKYRLKKPGVTEQV